VFTTNDSNPSAKYAIRLADYVWRLFRSVQGLDRFFSLSFCVSESRQLTLLDTERIANSAFEIVTRLNKDHFAAIVHYGSFADLTVCITEFCKVSKYQKISLLAIAMLRGVIPIMLECPECSLTPETTTKDSPGEDNMIRYWFPVLFGFYDIIMNGEDLEVRRLCVSHALPYQLVTQAISQGSRFVVFYS
jgi:Sec7-like guanine-nucleotide exchange factor